MRQKKQFCPTIPPDWFELFKGLTDKQKADILMGITLYPNHTPKDNPIWDYIKIQIDKQYQAFIKISETRTRSVKMRWESRQNDGVQMNTNEYKCIQTYTQKEPPLKETTPTPPKENKPQEKYIPPLSRESTPKGVVPQKKIIKFKKPSVDEVREYITASGFQMTPEEFIDFYESNGWKVGKNPMKDWKSAVRTWNRRRMPKIPDPPPIPAAEYVVKKADPVFLVEENQFFIDDTMDCYKEVLKGMSQKTIERCWKWIMEHKKGVAVYSSWVVAQLKKFAEDDQKNGVSC